MNWPALISSIVSSSTFIALFASILGAIVGGRYSLRAAIHAHQLSAKTAAEQEQRVLYNTAKLILLEIKTALTIFQEEYGSDLFKLPPDEPYVTVFPLGKNPFPIYDSSPACLSLLPPDFSYLLVRTYMRAKGLVSMVEMNNNDSERVHDLTRAKLNLSELMSIDEKSYCDQALAIAATLGMGSTANGMRGLTLEIVGMFTELESKFKEIPLPPPEK